MKNDQREFMLELASEIRQEERLARERNQRKRKLVKSSLLVFLIVGCAFIPQAAAITVPGLSLLGATTLDPVIARDVLDTVYPVGKIYISTTNIDPNSQFGGTWNPVGEGRVLVGQGGGFTAGDSGGAPDGPSTVSLTGSVTGVNGTVALTGSVTGVGADVTLTGSSSVWGNNTLSASGSVTLGLTNLPVHSHTMAHTHTMNHNHTYLVSQYQDANPDGWKDHSEWNYNGTNYGTFQWPDPAPPSAAPIYSYPTYAAYGDPGYPTNSNFKRYYWGGNNGTNDLNRTTSSWSGTSGAWSGTSGNAGTASPSSVTFASAGSVSSTAPLTGSASAKIPTQGWSGTAAWSGAISGLTGSAAVTSITDKTMQPYLVVYMWKRVA